jgi:hypothetical protein
MRHIFIGCLVVLSVAPVSSGGAARRRAAPSIPKTAAPSSDCHTFGFVTAGTKASYLSTTSNGNVTYTITWISDTASTTKLTAIQ